MPVSGPVSSSSWIPAACNCAESAISSAALRARRLSSCTVRITGWPEAACLISCASASAFSSSGRIFTLVLIFSENTRLHSARSSVSSRALEFLPGGGAPGIADPDRHARRLRHRGGGRRARCPCLAGPRAADIATSRSSLSAGTRMNRAVWYLTAVLPPWVRQGLPAGAAHFGQSWRSTAAAA